MTGYRTYIMGRNAILDPVITRSIHKMVRAARRTVDRTTFVVLYLERRFVRTYFRSWLKYYD